MLFCGMPEKLMITRVPNGMARSDASSMAARRLQTSPFPQIPFPWFGSGKSAVVFTVNVVSIACTLAGVTINIPPSKIHVQPIRTNVVKNFRECVMLITSPWYVKTRLDDK